MSTASATALASYDALLKAFPPPGLATVVEQAALVQASACVGMLQEIEHVVDATRRLVNMVEAIAYPLRSTDGAT